MSRNDYSGHSLVVGRFQPFHNGHMEVLRKCASESDHLVIGIGSAQYSHYPSDPFTAGERYLMINNSLRDEGISNYSIVPMEDLNRFSVWVAHVVSMAPPFKRVYTNNPMTKGRAIITNSNKLRTYSVARYLKDDDIRDVLCGKEIK